MAYVGKWVELRDGTKWRQPVSLPPRKKRRRKPVKRKQAGIGLLANEARTASLPALPETHVYIIGASGHPVKVGIADVPAKRLVDLQVGNPVDLRVYATRGVPRGDARSIERECHQRMSCHRLRGEWFDRSAEEALAVLDLVLRLRREG